MIYYDGDAVPELKGMFLFGTFNGHIIAVKLSDDKTKIVQEIDVHLGHYPFVPTIAIAQSPDGRIYYGGYKIYTLDSIGEREQMLFTVQVDAPSAVDVAEVIVDQAQNRVVIDASVNGTISPDATLTAKIPRTLLDSVTTVAIDGQQGTGDVDFSIDDSSQSYTTVTVRIGSALENNNLRLAIVGTNIIPEFPAAGLMIALAFAAIIAATLAVKKRGLWT